MVTKADLQTGINNILGTPLQIVNGRVVPESKDIAFLNGAVRLDATYLYSDLADSSKIAQVLDQQLTAKIIQSFVNSATNLLKARGGEIRSFDGDRVMAIFIGDQKNEQATRGALEIQYAVREIIWPSVLNKWPTINQYWTMKHGTGIATGQALLVRGGVRGDNDIISVGDAPNVAAKLSELRGNYSTFITDNVYNQLPASMKPANVWYRLNPLLVGGKQIPVIGSAAHCALN